MSGATINLLRYPPTAQQTAQQIAGAIRKPLYVKAFIGQLTQLHPQQARVLRVALRPLLGKGAHATHTACPGQIEKVLLWVCK